MLILVVEDDRSVSRFLVRGLREEGHTVDLCEDGVSALAQGAAQPYDAIVLDWMLPDLDGLSVLRGWRERGVDSAVIMLTARADADAVIMALDAGADDHLAKPFSFEVLLARVRAIARRTLSHADTSRALVALGDAALDTRARTIERGGEVVELSKREFEVLDALLRHRGEVLSRTRLLDRVWGMSHDPTTNVVDVYVRYLRAKLDPPGCAPGDSIIETVRGRGYRLRAVDAEAEASP